MKEMSFKETSLRLSCFEMLADFTASFFFFVYVIIEKMNEISFLELHRKKQTSEGKKV
jgi:hypothetical protein